MEPKQAVPDQMSIKKGGKPLGAAALFKYKTPMYGCI
jgi:hypothetical protein